MIITLLVLLPFLFLILAFILALLKFFGLLFTGNLGAYRLKLREEEKAKKLAKEQYKIQKQALKKFKP